MDELTWAIKLPLLFLLWTVVVTIASALGVVFYTFFCNYLEISKK